MTRYSRKKGQSAPNRKIGRRCGKTKHYRKDADQILDEMRKGIDSAALKRPYEMVDELPANGSFLCIECDRFFVDQNTLQEHKRSKPHKKRVRELKQPAYSHKEAEQAAGMGSYTIGSSLDSESME